MHCVCALLRSSRILKTGAVFWTRQQPTTLFGIQAYSPNLQEISHHGSLELLLLRNWRFRVHMGDKTSAWRTQKNGLPQSSVLAPTLFNLYTNDLPVTHVADLPMQMIFAAQCRPRHLLNCNVSSQLTLPTLQGTAKFQGRRSWGGQAPQYFAKGAMHQSGPSNN